MDNLDKNNLAKRLIDFERRLVKKFSIERLKVPLHLVGGNEIQLIDIFEDIRPQDWVFTSHRSHYHALLKGIPESELEEQILKGNGMTIMSNKYKFYGSGIVSGHLPVAVGIALGIKLREKDEKVYAFCGDMSSTTGTFYECSTYAQGHDLPIEFIVEDNGLSITTPTSEVWGNSSVSKVKRYRYNNPYPHHGFKKGEMF